MKNNVNKKKRKVSKVTIAAAVLAATVVPAIVMETTKAEASFDATKVNESLFNVINVSGGVTVGLTTAALSSTEQIHVPATIGGQSVVGINADGFKASKALSIYFEDPSTITSIGKEAFGSSKATNAVSFPNVTSIPDSAFFLTNFSEITFDPDKITTIGKNSFASAKATNAISFPNVTIISEYSFSGAGFSEITFDPNKVTRLDSAAFYNAKATNAISLTNVTSIPKHAFSGSAFSEITLNPDKVTTIIDNAFYMSKATNSLSFPNVTSIPNAAFSITKFSEITFDPNKVTSIGEDAFSSSSATNPISFLNITSIPSGAFAGSKFSSISFDPDKIISIGKGAFGNSKATNAVSFPKVTTILRNTFMNSSFSEITFDPAKITSLGEEAFSAGRVTLTKSNGEVNVVTESNVSIHEKYVEHDGVQTPIVGNSFAPQKAGTYKVTAVETSTRKLTSTITISEADVIVAPTQTPIEQGYSVVNETATLSLTKNDNASLSVDRSQVDVLLEDGVLYYKVADGADVDKFTITGLDDSSLSTSVTIDTATGNLYTAPVVNELEGYTALTVLGSLTGVDLTTIISTDSDLKVVNSILYFKLKDPALTEFTLTSADLSQTFNANGTLKEVTPTEPEIPTTPTVPADGSELLQLDGGSLSISHQGASDNHTVSVDLKSKKEVVKIPLTDKMIVTDARGTLEGWSLTVSAGRLTEMPVDGTFARETAHTLKEGTLLLTGATVDGSQVQGINVLNTKTAIDKDSAITIGSAAVQSGGGISTFGFVDGLELIIDPTDIVVNNKSGVTKATYSTTLNWTLTSGPTN